MARFAIGKPGQEVRVFFLGSALMLPDMVLADEVSIECPTSPKTFDRLTGETLCREMISEDGTRVEVVAV